jgi:hypothetical protein
MANTTPNTIVIPRNVTTQFVFAWIDMLILRGAVNPTNKPLQDLTGDLMMLRMFLAKANGIGFDPTHQYLSGGDGHIDLGLFLTTDIPTCSADFDAPTAVAS